MDNESSTSTAPLPAQPARGPAIEPVASTSKSAQVSSPAESNYGTRSRSGISVGGRLRAPPQAAASSSTSESSRLPRISLSKPKFQATKLKLKLGDKLAAQAPGMSFLGPYDRELDSDDEELAFEEHFVLRMPPGEDCDKLRKMANSREIGQDVWFKFKDSRRAQFHIGNTTYSAKLVDLPSIVESQKTLDNRQMFKVADVCQMLLVEKPITGDDATQPSKGFNIEEFIYPHGLTPPLRHVRKRRFRKRVNRRTIESVEQEVERLLDEDTLAADVQYEVLDNVNPDLSDSEFIERDESEILEAAQTPTAMSDMGDAPTPAPGMQDNDDEDDGDIDEELAAELDMALEDDESESGEDESADESGEDESGDEEQTQARKLLNEEIRDLENAISKKEKELGSTTNPLIKKRFEDTIKKLSADLESKRAQRNEMDEKARMEKEGMSESKSQDPGEQSADDMFGDDEMDIE